ncbi:MAG TPA: hypothetical protein VEI28_07530 [Thermodesulfovibrionales bacterium]|nr:hypothetical protein [Thermodesulfovibrionales bacterium]
MAIRSQKIEPHWNYLLAIERDVEELSRYIEFDSKNFDCFSIELARLLLACGAEIDVVCKQICRDLNPQSTADSIGLYRTEIITAYPDIPTFEVQIPRFGLVFHPWDEWTKPSGIPFWWTAYNKTKHHRDSEYHQANLKNALNAVAGLFVMVLYLYREKAAGGELVPPTQLLRVSNKHYGGSTQGNFDMGINYKI